MNLGQVYVLKMNLRNKKFVNFITFSNLHFMEGHEAVSLLCKTQINVTFAA